MSKSGAAGIVATEPGVLTEVPDELKRLAKYVMRGFYSVEHALIVDILTRNPIVREDDIALLLKFDKKQLRILLNKLKAEKLVKQTMRMETQQDGRTNRQNYYFINYKVFVNVVKYKMDKMRQKTESKERDSSCKALFKCPQCARVYNEFDAGELIDPMTGLLHCTLCGAEVQEDESAMPKKDAYMQMAIFNEQMKIIFDLLKQVEHVKLAQSLLEPSPLLANERRIGGNTQRPSGQHGQWSGDATRNSKDMYNQEVTINVGEEANADKASIAPAKERPIWLTNSTVEGAVTEPMEATSDGSALPTSQSQRATNKKKEEIMRALLAHESRKGAQVVIPEDNKSDESDVSEDEDDQFFPSTSSMPVTNDSTVQMDSGDEEDDEEEEVMVMVAGQPVPFQEVTDEQVALMTPLEKEDYIKLGQEAYASMYE